MNTAVACFIAILFQIFSAFYIEALFSAAQVSGWGLPAQIFSISFILFWAIWLIRFAKRPAVIRMSLVISGILLFSILLGDFCVNYLMIAEGDLFLGAYIGPLIALTGSGLYPIVSLIKNALNLGVAPVFEAISALWFTASLIMYFVGKRSLLPKTPHKKLFQIKSKWS